MTVGEVPRTGEEFPELAEPERLWNDKYGLALDGRHAWLRLTPRKIVSWDFRKIAARTRKRASAHGARCEDRVQRDPREQSATNAFRQSSPRGQTIQEVG